MTKRLLFEAFAAAAEAGRDAPYAPSEVREVISDPRRIHALFRNVVAEHRVARIWPRDGESIEVTVFALTAEGGDRVRFRLSRPLLRRTPFFIELAGATSVYWIPVLDVACDHERRTLDASLPPVIVRLRRRRTPRAAVPPGYTVRVRHPSFGRWLERPVRDLARHGLSFDTFLGDDSLHEGETFDVELHGDGAAICLRGELRSLIELGDGRRVAGAAVSPATGDDLARWTHLVGSILHPNTTMMRGCGEALWSLYEDSGYLNLSGAMPERFRALRDPFVACVDKLARAPQLGGHVVWRSGDRICASAGILRAYTGSWLGFQMAKIPGAEIDGVPRRRILRDLLVHAFEHASLDREPCWIAAHYQVGATIGRLTHHQFAEQHAASGDGYLLRFRAVEIDATQPIASEEFDTGPATPQEREALVEAIAAQRPWAYVDALDLGADRLDLGELREAWARVGLRREREILAARRHGVVRAVAVVEAAEPGLHLFGLLDATRIFGVGTGSEAAIPALLDAAKAWYRARGHARFVWIAEGAQSAQRLQPGWTDLGLADMTLVSGRVLPDLLEHIDEVTAPRSV